MKALSKSMSIIDKEVTVEGMVSFRGQLVVKGAVKGNLFGDKVIIAQEGSVNATTTVSEIIIGGVFDGEIKSTDKMTILSTGRCSGKITCKKFEVETGGILNAEVTCR